MEFWDLVGSEGDRRCKNIWPTHKWVFWVGFCLQKLDIPLKNSAPKWSESKKGKKHHSKPLVVSFFPFFSIKTTRKRGTTPHSFRWARQSSQRDLLVWGSETWCGCNINAKPIANKESCESSGGKRDEYCQWCNWHGFEFFLFLRVFVARFLVGFTSIGRKTSPKTLDVGKYWNHGTPIGRLPEKLGSRKLRWLAGKLSMNESMYFLFNMRSFRLVMLVFRGKRKPNVSFKEPFFPFVVEVCLCLWKTFWQVTHVQQNNDVKDPIVFFSTRLW